MDATPEQRDAVDLFGAELGLAVEAGAGTGKTSTLQLMGRSTSRRGQYLAFNRSIVEDAKRKMPRNVAADTVHQLAMRTTGRTFRHRLDSGRVQSHRLAAILDVRHFSVKYGAQTKVLQPGYLASLVMRTITKFCYSADPEPTTVHVPYIAGIDVPDKNGPTFENNEAVRAHIAPAIAAAWRDLCTPDGHLPYRHDHYLKLWQLGEPRIPGAFIMLDEAQDASPVMLAAIAAQDSQLVFVGDSQQQIYCQPAGTLVRTAKRIDGRTWGSDEVPIEQVRVGDRVVSWGGSWRLGAIHRRGSKVTDRWSEHVKGRLVTVETESGLRSRYTPDHHCVVMLGRPMLGQWVVYMMRRDDHYRVGACQAWYESQDGAFGPIVRARQEEADAVWVLSSHVSKRGALDAEAACHATVPSRCFLSSGGGSWWADQGPGRDAAAQLLDGYSLSIDAPLLTRTDWFDRTRSPFVTQARNLLDGMLVLAADNAIPRNRSSVVTVASWEPIKVGWEPYDGEVVSLTVNKDHTYVADGIVTHNSWRGAVNALQAVPADARTFLTNSWRFGPAIAEVANHVLGQLHAELRLVGRGCDSTVERVRDPRCILTRTNAIAVSALLNEQRRGRVAHLIGGGEEVLSFARAAGDLKAGIPTMHPELACFVSWTEVCEYVEQDPQGDELRLLVDLVEEFGVDTIVACLDPAKMPPEDRCDVVVSTAHKAKGREWPTVRLASDFTDPRDALGDPREEWRLLYVASTRAQQTLDVTECGPLADLSSEVAGA